MRIRLDRVPQRDVQTDGQTDRPVVMVQQYRALNATHAHAQ